MADDRTPPTVETTPEAGPGALLRAARERKGLSLQDVADGLNLKPRTVEALEQERYEQLPPRTFVKGYFRSYAKLVDVKDYDVLAALDRQLPEPSPSRLEAISSERDAAASPVGWFKWLLLLALLAGGLLLLYQQLEEPNGAPAPQPVVEEPPAQQPAEAETPFTQPQGETESPQPVPEPASEAVTAVPTPAVAEPAAEQAPTAATSLAEPAPVAPAAEPAPPAEASASGQLVVNVSGESWLEVRDAGGQRRFIGIARGPRTYQFSGTPPFSVVVGDVSAVQLRYNGEPVPLERYARGDVARLSVPASR
jgi:cytoskeleton protein RodZ